MKIGIKSPCSENWDKMESQQNKNRFCGSCQKSVVDFRSASKGEIVDYLSNQKGQVCGRFRTNQLDFPIFHETIDITNTQIKNRRYYSNTIYMITVTGLLLTGCGSSNQPNNKNQIVEVISSIDSIKVDTAQNIPKDSLLKPKCNKTNTHPAIIDSIEDLPEIPEMMGEIMGDIETDDNYAWDGSDAIDTSKTYAIVDQLPEFIGGTDSMRNFINANIKYPKWEQENNIQGNVYVQFTIDMTGELKDPIILKSVNGSKNLDEEVLRVISTMPVWKPGRLRDTIVKSQLVLPVKFKL